MKKFRIFCTTDGKQEYVISDSVPTQCPVNGAHSVDASSVCVVEENISSNDGTSVDSLANYKKLKNAEIDNKTRELIGQGFVYDSIVFSLSETAQRNWMGINSFRDELTYPFKVSTKDDGEYSFADAATVHTFVLTALGAAEYQYATGRSLKQSVNAATTETEVDAVVDNR